MSESKPEEITVEELVKRYCERQAGTPEEVMARLAEIAAERKVEGWMLLEAQLMYSSFFGCLAIVPWGEGCTWKQPPQHPMSVRGLASDTSVVVAVARYGQQEKQEKQEKQG